MQATGIASKNNQVICSVSVIILFTGIVIVFTSRAFYAGFNDYFLQRTSYQKICFKTVNDGRQKEI